MQVRATTFTLRMELLSYLDQQIEMLSNKTFSAFTKEEMGSFRSREKRIRELQQELATFPVPNFSLTESLPFG
jgi:hypothetical protein